MKKGNDLPFEWWASRSEELAVFSEEPDGVMGICCIHSFIIHFFLLSLFWSSKKGSKKDASYEGFLLCKTVSKTPRRTPFTWISELFFAYPCARGFYANFIWSLYFYLDLYVNIKKKPWPLSKTIENQRSSSGQKIKSCPTLKGEFFLSVAGDSVVFSYGFWGSLDFFGSFFYQEKNEHLKWFASSRFICPKSKIHKLLITK